MAFILVWNKQGTNVLVGLNGTNMLAKVTKQFIIRREFIMQKISKQSAVQICQMLMSGVSEAHAQTSVSRGIDKDWGESNPVCSLRLSDYLKKELKTRRRFPIDVINYSNGNNKTVHPTQKPIDLLEYLIKTYTNEGMTVLDNTMGSGSTGVAAVNLNRNFIGMELDKDYFKIAQERILGSDKHE